MSDLDTAGSRDLAPRLGEVIPPGEPAAIEVITQKIETQVRAAAVSNPPARRDAHAKAHGCVRAHFEVLDNLPANLRVGVFARPRVFPAWVRFSNGSGTPTKDSTPDGRGMAIKLMGVEDSPSTTQDFLMIDNPAFFVRNAADYVVLQTASNILKFFFPGFNPFNFRFHELRVALAIGLKRVSNPLNLRYWTMVPISFGDIACKFSARPCPPLSSFTARGNPNMMRVNMAAQLAAGDFAFDFMVQLRTNPATMPIEDATIAWDETASPFIPVARVTIPRQVFSTPQQNAFCENLSFTPWHCVDAHRPLGGINRVRRVVYEAISSLRHRLNLAPRIEPTDFTVEPSLPE